MNNAQYSSIPTSTTGLSTRGRQPVGYIDESGMPMPMINSQFSDEFAKSVKWIYNKQELQAAIYHFNETQRAYRDEKVNQTFAEATRAAEEERVQRNSQLKGFLPAHYNAAVFGGVPAVGAFAGLGGTPVSELSDTDEQ